MKISKIPGLGRFGIFIDDIDLFSITDDEWMEIGRMHLDSLVTILRDTKLDVRRYDQLMKLWGRPRLMPDYRMVKKYGLWFDEIVSLAAAGDDRIEPADAQFALTVANMVQVNDGKPSPILRVSGRKDDQGRPLGMFAEGELLWHSNESGNLCAAPAVSLLGGENMIGSSTGFATTADFYENLSESTRTEFDDMIVVHKFTPGRINPGLREEQDYVMHNQMCPVDNVEIPLVRVSPGGITGLHYSQNTINHIKGMTQQESQRIFDMIEASIFSEHNVYDHWYQSDSDLCLFDNSITQHRRLGDTSGRLCYRIQYDFDYLVRTGYQPYRKEPFRSLYVHEISDIMSTMRKTDYVLPSVTDAS